MSQSSPYHPPQVDSSNVDNAVPSIGRKLLGAFLFFWMFVLVVVWLADGLNILLPTQLGKSLQFGSLAISVFTAVAVLYCEFFGTRRRYIVLGILGVLEFLAFSAIGNHTIYQGQ